ncbi:MAG: 8-amino-7-oxononanoate synthase [Gammaproteobacteria bacterium]|nr:8-amino-7-oxononanoate synthase [Gammaproteobacteria bacterium]
MHALTARVTNRLATLRAQDLLRVLDVRGADQGPTITIGDRAYINFSSNDYLALAADPGVIAAAADTLQASGFGSGASPLLSGRHELQHELERRIAKFLGFPAALTFNSGYAANTGTLAALLQRSDTAYSDRLNHASLIDGVRLSRADSRRYHHCDPEHLAALLVEAKPSSTSDTVRMIITDGLFSMDGDIAPLPTLRDLAHQHQSAMYVDDAHGIGVVGPDGKGSLQASGVAHTDVTVLAGTFGKAFGSAGAFVTANEELISLLFSTARTYIFSTALPAVCSATALAALTIIETEPERRELLAANVNCFVEEARRLGLPVSSSTHIQPLIVGDAAASLNLSAALADEGFYVRAVRPPTVPPGGSRLRFSLSAGHTHAQIRSALQAVAHHWERLRG